MTTAMYNNQKEDEVIYFKLEMTYCDNKSEGIEEVHSLGDSSPKSENAFK